MYIYIYDWSEYRFTWLPNYFYILGLGDCKFDIKKSLIPPTRNVYKSQFQPFFVVDN